MREYNPLEIICGSPHFSFDISDSSVIGEARRHAIALANEMGCDDIQVGRVALIVTELGTNLFKHAKKGRLLIATRISSNPDIEVLSIDASPGIPNLDYAMRDGYSTSESAGIGLGAVQRLADEFDIFSNSQSGTIIIARVKRYKISVIDKQKFNLGIVGICAPMERVSGDGWAVVLDGTRAALLMADGLGHGPEANEAANSAINEFLENPFGDLASLLKKSHIALRFTRGAAISIALIDTQLQKIKTVGAGNIVTRLVSATSNRSLLSQFGTVGVCMKRVEEISYPLPPNTLVIMHTDGLLSRWKSEILNNLITKDPSIAAGLILRDFCRGRDDATILVLQTHA